MYYVCSDIFYGKQVKYIITFKIVQVISHLKNQFMIVKICVNCYQFVQIDNLNFFVLNYILLFILFSF